MTATDPTMPRYYRRPARELQPGMCTDDGQEILHVDVGDDLVIAEVYTPRPDDPALDAHNRATPESRIHRPGDLVYLAVFDPQVPTVDTGLCSACIEDHARSGRWPDHDCTEDERDTALSKGIRELAATIANQAQALADGTHTGPAYGVVALLAYNVATLQAWVPDDRT